MSDNNKKNNQKESLKEILKPLVKQCVRETINEMLLSGKSGLLSGIIKEVVVGLNESINISADNKENNISPEQIKEQQMPKFKVPNKAEQINEHKKMLLKAIGSEAYGGVDFFAGTTPIKKNARPIPSEPSTDPVAMSRRSPLADLPAGDAGVDISMFFGNK